MGIPHDMEVMTSSLDEGAGDGTALLARSSAMALFRASAALASASWISRREGPDGVLTSLSSLTAHGAGLGVLEDRSGVATAGARTGASATDGFREEAALVDAGADGFEVAGVEGVCSLASDDRREAGTAPQAEAGGAAGAGVGSSIVSACSAASVAGTSGSVFSCGASSSAGSSSNWCSDEGWA